MTEKYTTPSIVLYHAHCPDGFGAAWAAWKKLGDTAMYVPYQHNRTELPDVRGKIVYTLDMTLPEPAFSQALKEAEKLISIDHHITGKDRIARSSDHRFDNSHSGASLAWSYFHPDTVVPRLIQYIEDNDLWLRKLPHAQEIPALTWLSDYDFETWDVYAKTLETTEGFEECLKKGSLLLKAFLKQAGELADEHYFIEFEGMRVPVVNAAGHVSEVGHRLYTKYPPMALMWSRKKEAIVVSLRSDGSCDVSAIAVAYGGGGHAQSSGFTILLNQEPDDSPVSVRQQELLRKLLSRSA